MEATDLRSGTSLKASRVYNLSTSLQYHRTTMLIFFHMMIYNAYSLGRRSGVQPESWPSRLFVRPILVTHNYQTKTFTTDDSDVTQIQLNMFPIEIETKIEIIGSSNDVQYFMNIKSHTVSFSCNIVTLRGS